MQQSIPFVGFPKMPRLFRGCIITEKIDGTNASIYIGPDGQFLVGSRTRWITPDNDNFGFARWAYDNQDELMGLGEGHHFGEWWGQGIQRGYNLGCKRFSLFNAIVWADSHNDNDFVYPLPSDNPKAEPRYQKVAPECCHVVPDLYRGNFGTATASMLLEELNERGSYASPGFMNPEGIVVYHLAARMGFKQTLGGDKNKGNQ
jgi:hypothetical protein